MALHKISTMSQLSVAGQRIVCTPFEKLIYRLMKLSLLIHTISIVCTKVLQILGERDEGTGSKVINARFGKQRKLHLLLGTKVIDEYHQSFQEFI